MNDKPMVKLSGHRIDLSDGRSVFVGRKSEPDDSVYFEFCASDGTKTNLRLSDEATLAMRELLNDSLHGPFAEVATWIATVIEKHQPNRTAPNDH